MGAGDRPAALDVDLAVRTRPRPSPRRRRTRPRCTTSPGTGVWTSATSTTAPLAELDDARVGELAAALGVERGAVEHDLDLVALGRAAGTGHAVDEQAAHRRLADDLVVAGELDRAGRRRTPRGRRRRRRVPVFFALASALARSRCSVISAAEALLVDRQALLGRHLEGEVDREAVGVVQRNAWSPASTAAPARFVSAAARSKMRGAGAQRLPGRRPPRRRRRCGCGRRRSPAPGTAGPSRRWRRRTSSRIVPVRRRRAAAWCGRTRRMMRRST